MATVDGRISKGGNRCACGKSIGAYASRCKSCNMQHQHATGIRTWKVPRFRGPHTHEARASIAAANRGRKWTPEATARRIANDSRYFCLKEADLRNLYLVQGLSCSEIARHLGCDRDTVRRAMDRFGIARRSKAEESRLRFTEHPTLRVRLGEATSRRNRERWKDPAYQAAMRAALLRSLTPERRAAISERNRARREDPAYRQAEDARLAALSRSAKTKPWARNTIAKFRCDPVFEAKRRAKQRASVQEAWEAGRLGPKGKVPYTRRDGTVIQLGSWAEAIVALCLDECGRPWERPQRSLRLPERRTYRPDFWLPDVGRFLEVKGGKNWEDAQRARQPGREANIRAAQRAGLPVDLLEISYPGPQICQDLAEAARKARTLGGRPLLDALGRV